MQPQHTVTRSILVRRLSLAGLALLGLGLSATPAAADPTGQVLHIEIYNGTLVARTECLVSGKKNERFGVGGHKLLEKLVLPGPGTHNKTVTIPSEYPVARVQCSVTQNTEGAAVKQKPGVTEQLLSRQPVATQKVKAGCGSAASNASCAVNVVGR